MQWKELNDSPKEKGWYLLKTITGLPNAVGRAWFSGSNFKFQGTSAIYAKAGCVLLWLDESQSESTPSISDGWDVVADVPKKARELWEAYKPGLEPSQKTHENLFVLGYEACAYRLPDRQKLAIAIVNLINNKYALNLYTVDCAAMTDDIYNLLNAPPLTDINKKVK